MKVVLTGSQKINLEKLWFLYGNGGAKYTLGNHKFIQGLLESNEDYRKFYVKTAQAIHCLTQECIAEVDKIIDHIKIGDRVKVLTEAIHQESQRPLNRMRGKVIAIEQNCYIVKMDGFWDRLPFAGNELVVL